MNQRELLQELQDTYAEKLQLTIIITDISGKAVTSFSHLTSIAEYTIASINRNDKEQLTQSEWIKKLENPILIDSQNISPYIGMKIIIAPIQIGDTHHYYLWAGNLVEEGYKPFVLQSFQKNKAISKGIVTADLKELSIGEIEEKVRTVKNMAVVIEELMAGHHMKEDLSSIREVLMSANKGDLSTQERYRLYLKEMVDLDRNIDIVVFAKKHGTHQYKVVSAEGKHKNLSSKIFTLGQTLVQECLERKQYGIWRNVNHLDDSFIHDFPISLKSMFCFPLIVEQQVKGIVFGGSETKDSSYSNLIRYGNVLISTMNAYLQIDLVKESLDRHFMKMSTLLDINRVLEVAANEDELLRMLADFALMFIPSDFCIVSLRDGKSIQNIKTDMIHSNELMAFQHVDRFNHVSEGKNQPKLVETNWGTILDYPIYYREELLGSMTVHLQDPSFIKEAEVYMVNLVNSGATAIKQLDLHKNGNGISINFGKTTTLEILTSRERDVLQLLIKGNNNREIAEELYISVHTVKNHITKIFQKLNVSDRSQLMAMVYQLNFMKSS